MSQHKWWASKHTGLTAPKTVWPSDHPTPQLRPEFTHGGQEHGLSCTSHAPTSRRPQEGSGQGPAMHKGLRSRSTFSLQEKATGHL